MQKQKKSNVPFLSNFENPNFQGSPILIPYEFFSTRKLMTGHVSSSIGVKFEEEYENYNIFALQMIKYVIFTIKVEF